MKTLSSLALLVAAALASAPALAQAPATAPDIGGPEDPPAIVEDRPVVEEEEEVRIRPGHEAFVQIQGTWATDQESCPIAGDQGGGLFVTDTIISWESHTCSIRNIDSQNGVATVHAFCATDTSRRDRTFHLEVTDDDTLTLRFLADAQTYEVPLERCEAGQ